MGYLDLNGLQKVRAHIENLLFGKVDKIDGKGLSTNDYTTAEKNKLSGITEGANKTTVDSAMSSSSTNPVQNKVVNTALNEKVPTSRTINGKALSSNITLNASDVNADDRGSAAAALTSAKSYTDSEIAELINGAPTTLDTLGEIATAMSENANVVDALNTAIGNKANTSDLTSHTNNKSNPHAVTKAQVGLGNVENKSSATIRGELTKANVTDALGYTPPTQDTTYSAATTSAAGLMSASDKSKLDGIASGANKITVDTAMSTTSTNPVQNKVVNTALSGKAPTSHASTATTYGAASASNYGHAMASSTTPKVAGTAAVGSETAKFARGDHVHPAQTSVSGNAGTATKLETARTISLTGDVTGSASFDGSANASITATVADNSHNHSASNITSGTLAAARLPAATTSAQGAMSAADKTRVDDLYKRIAGYAVTAGTTSAYTATITGVTLTHGTMIALRFNATNAKNATLDVNSLGAKPIYYKGAAITASRAPANAVMLLVYDTDQVSTGAWHCVYSYDANSTYSNASLGQGYATCSTAAATVAKTASLSSYALTTGGIVAVKFTYDVPANATLNINSKGAKAIYYKGAAITDKVIKAGDTATFIYSTQYHLISIDSGGSALTSDPREAEGEAPELSAVPINADSLGGILASEYATKEWVLNNIRFASEVSW